MILTLFLQFLRIGFFSIGGGYAIIPLIQECVVREKGWITLQEFTDIITISQMTPGPLAVNTSTFVGIRIFGLPGAAAATLGCVGSGFILSLLLYRFFCRHRDSEIVFQVLNGLKASSLGLIAAAGAVLLQTALFTPKAGGPAAGFRPVSAIIFIIALVLLRKWKLNPILVLFCAGAAGCFIY